MHWRHRRVSYSSMGRRWGAMRVIVLLVRRMSVAVRRGRSVMCVVGIIRSLRRKNLHMNTGRRKRSWCPPSQVSTFFMMHIDKVRSASEYWGRSKSGSMRSRYHVLNNFNGLFRF